MNICACVYITYIYAFRFDLINVSFLNYCHNLCNSFFLVSKITDCFDFEFN